MGDFDAPKTYNDLIRLLKEYEVMRWLGRTSRLKPSRGRQDNAGSLTSRSSTSVSTADRREATILGDLFAGDPRPLPVTVHPQTAVMTYNIRQVVSWITRVRGVPLDNALVYIQCNLLVNDNFDLAWEFLRYQPTTAWSTYIKGRLYLSRADYSVAAMHFKKAAFVLGTCTSLISNIVD